MAAATEQEAAAEARHRLAQANTAHSALTHQLADARIRLATRQHLDRLVDQRPPEEQPDANYAHKLLERANQLRQEVDARARNRVVATAVINAIDQQVLITNHLATTAPGQSDQEIAKLLKRKDDLSFQLLSIRKDLRATTLERTKLRRRLHALNRDNAASVAFLEKRREPPLLSSVAAEELVAQLSPALQAYHASLNDALVVTSARLVRLNHIFQKLVAELALPLHTYLSPSSSTTSAAPRLARDAPPPPSARALPSGEGTPSSSTSSSSHPTLTRIPTEDVEMVEKQQRGDSVAEQGHRQRGQEREEEEEAEAVWLTPSKLLELVLLAGRHVDEEFDRTAADDDHHDPSDDDEEANMWTTTQKEEGKDDDLELELVDEPDEEDGEEVKAEMAEWERIRKEQDPWLVVRRKEREKREGERRGLSS
ncbi:hypothetical protein RHOSPDRAFT_35834 [Rhodotorula sp. JG-1b]|nr:hypothetical protein RHOSPDRAFT_35834 [Rhodotorula sp. JG-1b]